MDDPPRSRQNRTRVAVDTPTPVPWRPSDQERDVVVRSLRDGTAAGRLSTETFSRRLERAYSARSQRELDELVIDLPPSGRLHRRLVRTVERLAATAADLRGALREPHAERLQLPGEGNELVLGRAPDCDCVIAAEVVSRRHARIRRVNGAWAVRDLGSLNGTRVNGWRVIAETEIRPGDYLSLGTERFRLTAPR
jgi:hypothetical protein